MFRSVYIAITLTALLGARALTAQVSVRQGDHKISVSIDGKPYTDFIYGDDAPKPFLHPLRDANGVIVTRHYPMESPAGESHDHQHHRGLWFAHGDVSGVNFWENEFDYKPTNRGRIVVKGVDGLKSGEHEGEIRATLQWLDPAGKPMLEEKRVMIFRPDAAKRTIDFDITLKAAREVTFADTKEGTFGLRVAPGLEEPSKDSLPSPRRTGVMRSSTGGSGEKEIWGKRADWVSYSGTVDGQKITVAVFDHPENPRHPTYWHARGYGLFAANVFGAKAFTGDSSLNGALTLKTGDTLRFRYRVTIFSDSAQELPKPDEVHSEWAAYSGQPAK